MIHWDWVWTVLCITMPSLIVSTIFSTLLEPIKTDRMKAEAALLEQKRLCKASGITV
jgi:predicted MFS family arabinose efflux permease